MVPCYADVFQQTECTMLLTQTFIISVILSHAICATLQIRVAAGVLLRAQAIDLRLEIHAHTDYGYKGMYP